jgi:hypothetical protein
MGHRHSSPPPDPAYLARLREIAHQLQLRQELARLLMEINVLNNEIFQQIVERNSLTQELNTIIADSKCLDADIAALNAKISKQELIIERITNIINNLTAKVAKLEIEVTKITAGLTGANALAALQNAANTKYSELNKDYKYAAGDSKLALYGLMNQENDVLITQYNELRDKLTLYDSKYNYANALYSKYSGFNLVLFILFYICLFIFFYYLITVQKTIPIYYRIFMVIAIAIYPFIISYIEINIYDSFKWFIAVVKGDPYIRRKS